MEPSDRYSVLVVDDDDAVGETLVARLAQRGFEARHLPSGELAMAFLQHDFADAVLADVRMPGMDGLELLRNIQREFPGTPVLMLTAHGSIQLAVEAMQAGAADFIEKAPDMDELVASLTRAIKMAPPESANPPPLALDDRARLERQPSMEKTLEQIRRAAPGMSTVLIRGETGSGKNVAARLLHDLSPRSKGPFITVHCSGIPETLLESELFGHEPGAFSDAGPKAKPGRVAWAKGGTLFLDEIGEVPLTIQAKLLHFLGREREYVPLGGSRTLTADVRVVAATHRNLEEMKRTGAFREDLYFRLNVFPVSMPPLRERVSEIEPLALEFLDRFAHENGRPGLSFSPATLRALTGYGWPGNIRQLENAVERLVVMSTGEEISLDVWREALQGTPGAPDNPENDRVGFALAPQLKASERAAILRALDKARANRALTARLLEISRRSLYYKLAVHGLEDWQPTPRIPAEPSAQRPPRGPRRTST